MTELEEFIKATGKSRAVYYRMKRASNGSDVIEFYKNKKPKTRVCSISLEIRWRQWIDFYLWSLKPRCGKGRHLSEETKKKLSEINKGHKPIITEETKRKVSEANERRINRVLENYPEYTLIDRIDDLPLTRTQMLRRLDAENKVLRVEGLCLVKLEDVKAITRLFGSSIEEDAVANFIKTIYNGDIMRNTRQIIKPLELDIYLPERNLAIEFDGLYWHKGDKLRALNKTIECEKKGIRLIHIYEDEWILKQDKIKSIISSALGVYKRKIYARNCEVRFIDKKVATEFLNNNHLNDSTRFREAVGLLFNNELVQVATFGPSRFKKETELIRMASLLNTQVIGGFSKICKFFNKDFVSYIDRRMYNGTGYSASGFKFISYTPVSYYYTNGRSSRFNRMKYTKAACIKLFNEKNHSLTEEQICNKNGLFRIYDCGCIKVGYSKLH